MKNGNTFFCLVIFGTQIKITNKQMALLTKRKREEIEIVDLIEDFDEDNETVQESPEQIIYHLTELPSPPRKKVKRKLNFTKLSMNDTPKKLSCKLRVTKDVMCDVSLTRLRGNVELYEEFKKQMRFVVVINRFSNPP